MNKFFKWLKGCYSFPEYIVLKTNDSNGTEVRYHGYSYKLHVTDQDKFNIYLKELHKTFYENLKKNENE